SLILPRLTSDQTYEQRKIPAVASLSRSAAVAVLRGESFSKFRVEEEYSAEVGEGKVIRTEPAEGTSVPVNTEITVYVSKGATLVMAINTLGQRAEEAADALRTQGFDVKIEYVTDESKPNGVVVEQSNSTQAIPLGSTITLKVVRNIEAKMLVVPNLLGKSLEEAREAILQAGFQVGRYQEEKVEDEQMLGVCWQSLPEGMEFVYQDGDKPPEVAIDFTVNVSSGFKCVYDYTVPTDEALDMELIVYNAQGDEIAYRKFSGTNHVIYEYTSSVRENVTFELYSGSQRIDKQTLTTELGNHKPE
ncbi:MAG: PASTA domain-containing protein, partial [Clostridia bacterium]|nr:PASTA domain-containing protein [Clostridia bacterium]